MSVLSDAITAALAALPTDRCERATVSVVNGDGTVDVTVPTGTVPKVRRLAHYSPTVTDEVLMIRSVSGDRFIVGKLA